MASLKSALKKISISCSMFLVYLLAGAAIFMEIEKSNHAIHLQQARDKWTHMVELLKTNYSLPESTIDMLKSEIKTAIHSNVFSDVITTWTFSNSFFFCGNVITTIGYGHITPETDLGRIIMILYALFGIPLTGFFLRTVGNELATLLAYLTKLFERRFYNREAERIEMKCAVIVCLLAVVVLLLGTLIFHAKDRADGNSKKILDWFYFSFVTLTTIGFGDIVPSKTDDEVTNIAMEIAFLVYYVLGLSIMSGVIVSISGVIEEKTKKLDVVDPMDAIRNLRIENLNSKAMKKLGYKMDEGVKLPPSMKATRATIKKGTVIPEEKQLSRKTSKLGLKLQEALKEATNMQDGLNRTEVCGMKVNHLPPIAGSPRPFVNTNTRLSSDSGYVDSGLKRLKETKEGESSEAPAAAVNESFTPEERELTDDQREVSVDVEEIPTDEAELDVKHEVITMEENPTQNCKQKASKVSEQYSKRLGLPAELFANNVHYSLGDQNNSYEVYFNEAMINEEHWGNFRQRNPVFGYKNPFYDPKETDSSSTNDHKNGKHRRPEFCKSRSLDLPNRCSNTLELETRPSSSGKVK